MPVTVFPARLPVLGVSPEAEESQYRENDDNCSDPPNDVVHGVLLAANGKCGRVVGLGNDATPLGVPACRASITAGPTTPQHCHVTF
jgi:hypothetical protein